MALIRDQAAAKKRPSSRAGQPPQPVGLRDFFVGKAKRDKHRVTGDTERREERREKSFATALGAGLPPPPNEQSRFEPNPFPIP
jgi:hypothetical protein